MTINDGFNGIIDVLASYTRADGTPLISSPDYWKNNAVHGGRLEGEYVRKLIMALFDKITI
jgi:hypothetical protein